MSDLVNFFQSILKTANLRGITKDERIHKEIIETLKSLIILDHVQNELEYQWKYLNDIDWDLYFNTPQRFANFRYELETAIESLIDSFGEVDNYSKILNNFEENLTTNER